MHYLHHSALLSNGLGLFIFIGFPLLHHIPSLGDGTMETKVFSSKVDAIPAQFSLAFNVFLKLIIVPYGYEDLVFNRCVEIKNMC
jgi:hypothetical protein